MGLFSKNKDKKQLVEKQLKIAVLQKVRPMFKTIDNVEHRGCAYKWCDSTGLLCSVGKFIMYEIKSQGYIEDDNEIMYPLTNVVSIDWLVIGEKRVVDNLPEYQLFFTNKEVEEMQVVE